MRLRRRATALLLSATSLLGGCGERSAPAPSAAASASEAAPAAPPPVEALLFPAGPSLLAEAPLLDLVPVETHAAVLLAGQQAFASALPEKAFAPETRDSLLAIAAEDLDSYFRSKADLAKLAAALDLDKPVALALLDETTETRAFYATVKDEAALAKLAKSLVGSKEVATAEGVKVWSKKGSSIGVVLRGGVAVFVLGGRWYRPESADAAARWGQSIAKLEASASIGKAPWLASAAAQIAFGRHAVVVVRPGYLTADALAFDRRRLEEETQNKAEKDVAWWKALIAEIEKARGAFEARSPALVLGIEVTKDAVHAKGYIPGPEGRAPFDPPRPLPPAFQELLSRSVRFYGNIGKDAAAGVGADHRFRIHRSWCDVEPTKVLASLSGDLVVLEKAAAWGVTDEAAVWAVLKSEIEKRYENLLDGKRWKIDDAARTIQCGEGGLRVASGWLLMSQESELLARFPNGGDAKPADVKPGVEELQKIEGVVARFRAPVIEPNPLRGLSGSSMKSLLDDKCAFGPGGALLGKPTEEQTKAYEKLCKERRDIVDELGKARSKADETTERLLGGVELLAKPAPGGAFVYGTWAMEAPSTEALASQLLEVWLPAAPSGERAKKLADIDTKLEAIREEILRSALDALPPFEPGGVPSFTP